MPTPLPPIHPVLEREEESDSPELRRERREARTLLIWTARRDEIARAIRKATARVERRIRAINGDVERGRDASKTATLAGLFVAAASRAPRGTTSLTVTDWSTGEEKKVTLPFEPAKTPREQLDAIFRTARRMKEGAKVALTRLSASRETLAALVSLQQDCEALAPLSDIEAFAKVAKRAAPGDLRLAAAPKRGEVAGRKSRDLPLPPYRTFRAATGEAIYVGRGAAHNDELTFHVSRPRDLWLHVKGHKGAHVIVPLRKGASCPADLLIDAAHLAMHFSDAREEDAAEVEYVQRGHVRKPRGSPPGLVVVDQGKALWLRKEEGRLQALLAREGTDPEPAARR